MRNEAYWRDVRLMSRDIQQRGCPQPTIEWSHVDLQHCKELRNRHLGFAVHLQSHERHSWWPKPGNAVFRKKHKHQRLNQQCGHHSSSRQRCHNPAALPGHWHHTYSTAPRAYRLLIILRATATARGAGQLRLLPQRRVDAERWQAHPDHIWEQWHGSTSQTAAIKQENTRLAPSMLSTLRKGIRMWHAPTRHIYHKANQQTQLLSNEDNKRNQFGGPWTSLHINRIMLRILTWWRDES